MKLTTKLLVEAAKRGLIERHITRDVIIYKIADAEIRYKILRDGRVEKIAEPSVAKIKQLLKSL